MELHKTIITRAEANQNFLGSILCSNFVSLKDEACFKLNGHVIDWSDVNAHLVIQEELNVPCVMVWGCISSSALFRVLIFLGKFYLKQLHRNPVGSGVSRT